MDHSATLALLVEKRELLVSTFDYEMTDSYYINLYALSALLVISLALVVFVSPSYSVRYSVLTRGCSRWSVAKGSRIRCG